VLGDVYKSQVQLRVSSCVCMILSPVQVCIHLYASVS